MKTHILIHHSAVSRDKNSKQFDAINNYHKSKGWGMIAYHYLIEPDGELKKGRGEDQNGAHCSEAWMNYKAIGICLTGNFDIEEPTKKQLEILRRLISEIMGRHNIPKKNILFHRDFATYKSCPGIKVYRDMILPKEHALIISKCKDIWKIANELEENPKYKELFDHIDEARIKILKEKASQIADNARKSF